MAFEGKVDEFAHFACVVCALCGFGGFLRVGVDAAKGEVVVFEADAVAVLIEELRDERVCGSAGGALQVGEFDDAHAACCRAEVGFWRDNIRVVGRVERDEGVCDDEERCDNDDPSAEFLFDHEGCLSFVLLCFVNDEETDGS